MNSLAKAVVHNVLTAIMTLTSTTAGDRNMNEAALSAKPRGLSLKSLARRILSYSRDLQADTAGSVAVIAAVMFPVLIGGMGLGAEMGYWYLKQRKLQHAADTSAHAGGTRLRAGDTKSQINAAALNVARNCNSQGVCSGLSTSLGTIVVNTPPVSGAMVRSTSSVEVILTEVHPRLFSSVFSSAPVTIKTRAVSTIVPGSKACVLALSPTASGAVTVSGSTNVDLKGCDVASNSNASNSFLMSGSAALSTGCVQAVGQAVTTSNLKLTQCAAVKETAPIVRDPYASVPEPAAVGACENGNVGSPSKSTTLSPTNNHPSGVMSMRFCKGLDLKGAVTFQPGLYIIEGGDLRVNGGIADTTSLAQLNGAGVTFYFTNGGALKLNNDASLNLSAPTSGPFSGILFFGSRTSAAASQKINGSSSSTLNGAIYMPGSDVQFNGNSSVTGGCTQVVARTVTFSGNSSLGSSCETAGTRSIETNETLALVE